MQKLRRFGVVAAVVGIVILAGAATETSAQGILKQILDRMDKHNRSLVSLKADVTMVKTDSVLGENDTSVGTTNYLPKTVKRPMYVRIDWTKPVQEQMAVIGDTYKIYRPRLNQLITGKVDRAKNSGKAGGALAFMSMSEAQLKANYSVRYIGEETVSGGAKTWHLELTPKTTGSYKSAELWVDSAGMPLQAKVIEKNNDSTTVLLSNLQKNITIKADVFDLKIPKGVRPIPA